MGMALREDVHRACREAGTDKPVDLAFLSAQTMGDASLEMEILSLFACQVREFDALLDEEMDAGDIYRFSHTLKGAARSIGAVRLAQLAEAAESGGKLDRGAIRDEFTRICEYVSRLRQDR